MNMDAKEDRAREAIIEQASGWFLRHRSGELSRAEKAQFLEWLRASKLNMREYFEQVRLHQAFAHTLPQLRLDRQTLTAAAEAELRGSVSALQFPARASDRMGQRKFAAVAAALVVMAGAGWLWESSVDAQRIRVPHGEQRIVQLPDGSTMHVNVSSQVEIKYSSQNRIVELDKGQAFFEVAHDARRPFKVLAGDAQVVAVGTQFDVYRRNDGQVVVTVLEGRVDAIDPAHAGRRIRLAAGEQIQLGTTQSPPAVRVADVRAAIAWMRREVIFNGESLAQVAQEINRYVAVPVLIEDEQLRKMRVRAVFNAYDSESFLAFLKQYDVAVDVSADAIRVRGGKVGVSEFTR